MLSVEEPASLNLEYLESTVDMETGSIHISPGRNVTVWLDYIGARAVLYGTVRHATGSSG